LKLIKIGITQSENLAKEQCSKFLFPCFSVSFPCFPVSGKQGNRETAFLILKGKQGNKETAIVKKRETGKQFPCFPLVVFFVKIPQKWF